MSGPNHIIGGTVVTGILGSFFDLNIFSSALYFFSSLFGCLFPDIDAPRSIMGRIFLPLSKKINSKWGHRTLLHSLVFLFPLYLFFSLFELMFFGSKIFSFIFFLGVCSHLLLDVVTISGVPLFFPLSLRPFVLPGNVKARLGGDNSFKQEMWSAAFFILVGLSLFPLYTNGFWTSLNKSIASIEQIHNEWRRRGDKSILITGSYVDNSENTNFTNYILSATQSKLTTYNIVKKQIETLNNNLQNLQIKAMSIHNHIPTHTVDFSKYSVEKINALIKNKIIKHIKLDATAPITVHTAQETKTDKNHELDNISWLTIEHDSTEKTEEINKIQYIQYEEEEHLKDIKAQLWRLENHGDEYWKETNFAEMLRLKKELKEFKKTDFTIELKQIELKYPKSYISGSLIYFDEKIKILPN